MIKSISSFIAGPAGICIALFFFLPWITVSCGDEFEGGDIDFGFPSLKVEASGLDLATGNARDDLEQQLLTLTEGATTGFEDLDFGDPTIDPIDSTVDLESQSEETALDAEPLLWSILIVGLGAAVLAGIRFMYPDLTVISGIVYIVLGIIGLVVQIMKYFDLEKFSDDLKASQEGADQLAIITMSYNASWWLTMLGLFVIVIAGLIALLLEDQLTTQPQPTANRNFNLPPVPPQPSASNPDDELPSWMNE